MIAKPQRVLFAEFKAGRVRTLTNQRKHLAHQLQRLDSIMASRRRRVHDHTGKIAAQRAYLEREIARTDEFIQRIINN